MTKWQSKPLAAMSLWDYDDLQKSLKENPEDTRPKLFKRIYEFFTKFPEEETDVDLVGETVILLNRVGAWSKIPADDLAPVLLKTNKKTRSVFFEELPKEVGNSFATAMQKAISAKRSEENLRTIARLSRKTNKKDVNTKDARVISSTTSQNRRSTSPLVLVDVTPVDQSGTGGMSKSFIMFSKRSTRAIDDDKQSRPRHVEIYDPKKRKKSPSSHQNKA